ncbi:CENP-B homolog protein 2-like protein [Tanacetum coccineum]
MGDFKSYVLIHNIAKRHNVGTLARSATAFGVSELILVGRRDFNSFGSHGSTSHLPFRHFYSLSDARLFLKVENDCDICGVEITDDAAAVNRNPFKKNTAFLLGNERVSWSPVIPMDAGLSPDLVKIDGGVSNGDAYSCAYDCLSMKGVPNPAKINVLDAMNLAISAWTMDVSANTIANCFRHCKLRSTDNMTFENSDEGGESTQELQNLIKELGYRNAMDVEDVLTHPEENVVAQLLTDEEIIESVIGINKDDIDEEDDESSTMEPPSRNEAIKAAITLNNFLLSYEKTTPEVLTMLRKIRDEIQGEIDFNKKQKTIESFFKKPS